MTLTIHPQMTQRSEEWFAQRCGMVTASAIGRNLMTPTGKVANNDTSRAFVATMAAERVTGHVEQTFTNDDMWRGIEMEPIARDLYSELHAPAVEVGFMVRDFGDGRLGYSPDGLVGDDGLIEIKAPRQKGHLTTILADAVPSYYMAQCQAGLLVSGREWLDFISYCAGMPMFVKRVHPDPKWQDALTEAVRTFELAVTEAVERYQSAVVGLPATERVDNLELIL